MAVSGGLGAFGPAGLAGPDSGGSSGVEVFNWTALVCACNASPCMAAISAATISGDQSEWAIWILVLRLRALACDRKLMAFAVSMTLAWMLWGNSNLGRNTPGPLNSCLSTI